MGTYFNDVGCFYESRTILFYKMRITISEQLSMKWSGDCFFRNPTICFPIVRTQISTQSIESLKQIEEKKLELDGIMQLIQESNKALEKDLEKLKNSEDKFNSFMDLWQTSLK